jgi:hypothetical protein
MCPREVAEKRGTQGLFHRNKKGKPIRHAEEKL